MPYLGKWVPASEAVAHVMRVDRCDRAAALRQIETAIADRVLRWFRPPEAARESRRNDDQLQTHDLVYRADLLKLWPEPEEARQPLPPPIFIDPREAVERVREASACSGDEAVRFLCDRWIAGEVTPRFTRGAPPGGTDLSLADWFAGAVILPGKRLPRRAVGDWNDDPEWQDVPGQSFSFLIDRRELETALSRVGAAPANPIVDLVKEGGTHVRTGGLPDDAISFVQAIELLAPLMGRHYPELEARRALAKGAADERLTAYARPNHAQHYEARPASLWRWCEVRSDDRGNYELACNHNGIVSIDRDIHFSRREVERLRDYLVESRASPAGITTEPASQPKTALNEPSAVALPDASEKRSTQPDAKNTRGAYKPHLTTYQRGLLKQQPEKFGSLTGKELWAGFRPWCDRTQRSVHFPKDSRKAERIAEAIRDELIREQVPGTESSPTKGVQAHPRAPKTRPNR